MGGCCDLSISCVRLTTMPSDFYRVSCHKQWCLSDQRGCGTTGSTNETAASSAPWLVRGGVDSVQLLCNGRDSCGRQAKRTAAIRSSAATAFTVEDVISDIARPQPPAGPRSHEPACTKSCSTFGDNGEDLRHFGDWSADAVIWTRPHTARAFGGLRHGTSPG
jgi:hypothetical protein